MRVNAPTSFSLLHLSPLLPEFLQRWQDVEFDVSFTDRFVDVVEEGVEVVIRIASSLPDSATLLVQRLARTRHVLVASPAYLRRNREPKTIADLERHACIAYSLSRTPGTWDFERHGKRLRAPVKGRLALNNSIAIRDAVLAGHGTSLLPAFYMADELRARRLRSVLDEHTRTPLFIYAAYQRSRHLSAKVRLFVEFLRERYKTAPWTF